MLIIYTDENGKEWHIEPKNADLYVIQQICERLMRNRHYICNETKAKITGPFTPKAETTRAAGVPGED